METGALAAAVLVLGVALLVVGRELRRRTAALRGVGRRIGAATTGPDDLDAAAGRLEDRATAAEARRDRVVRDLEFFGELIALGYLRFDDDLRVDMANPAAHAMLGVAPGRLAGRTAIEVLLDARAEALVRAAHDGTGTVGEIQVGTGDPRAVILRARRSPVRGTWVVLEDVTELRRLQQIRAEFVDNLSHELRTPLTTVSLLAETLAREAEAADVPARMRDRIGKIEVETGHLVQMVNELLDLARIEGGGGPVLLVDDVDLGQLAVASAERLRLFAERQGVSLRVEVEPDLPPVKGSDDRLGQVFVNLLHNAVKFSPEGGAVTVRVRRGQLGVVAEVEDRGVGIPAADRPRIFERFYKVDRARVRGGGTGLGLSISRHVVEQHGGRIWVESEEGRGSTFSFSVPAVQRGGGDAGNSAPAGAP